MNDDVVPDSGKTTGFNGAEAPLKGLRVLFFGLLLFVSFCLNAEDDTGEVNNDGTAVVVQESGDDGTLEKKELKTEDGEVAMVNGVKWRYVVVDGGANINVAHDKIKGTVIVPEIIDGYPVTRISAKAFAGCSLVTNVVVPSSVVSIGKRAFYACVRLRSVSMHGDGRFPAVSR